MCMCFGLSILICWNGQGGFSLVAHQSSSLLCSTKEGSSIYEKALIGSPKRTGTLSRGSPEQLFRSCLCITDRFTLSLQQSGSPRHASVCLYLPGYQCASVKESSAVKSRHAARFTPSSARAPLQTRNFSALQQPVIATVGNGL